MQPTNDVILAIAVFAAIGCGAMGGLLFAFSSFVMRALMQQTAECGVRTMQSINILIINPLFMIIFMGTAIASAVLAFVAVMHMSGLLLVGSLLYLVGVLGVTMRCNVPLNNKLAALRPEAPEAVQYWPVYVAQWQRWNHVRTVAALMAAGFIVVAARAL